MLPAARLTHHHDFYSNWIHHFEIIEPHSYLADRKPSARDDAAAAPLPAKTDSPWPLARIGEAPNIEPRVFDFLQDSRLRGAVAGSVAAGARRDDGRDRHLAGGAGADEIRPREFQIRIRTPRTSTRTCGDVLRDRRGVCQDFAHLMIGLCRALKIPALYVSGYLATETASATHAWVEVFVPGHGWLALDPTHNRQVDETYVKIAVGRDYADVSPISGNYRGTRDRKMEVEVRITSVV